MTPKDKEIIKQLRALGCKWRAHLAIPLLLTAKMTEAQKIQAEILHDQMDAPYGDESAEEQVPMTPKDDLIQIATGMQACLARHDKAEISHVGYDNGLVVDGRHVYCSCQTDGETLSRLVLGYMSTHLEGDK